MAYKGDVYADPDPIFGKLNWDVIPFTDPVILPVMLGALLGGLALVAAITYYGKWKYLWEQWFTSVDHKKIGIMYIIVAAVMLFRLSLIHI